MQIKLIMLQYVHRSCDIFVTAVVLKSIRVSASHLLGATESYALVAMVQWVLTCCVSWLELLFS